MANDFVLLENLLLWKFNNVPFIVQNSITYFSMDETYNFYQLQTILSTTYENHIFGDFKGKWFQIDWVKI